MIRGNFFKKKARYSSHSRQACLGGCDQDRPKWHYSREEARYCDQLALMIKAGEYKSYRGQRRYDLRDAHGKPCGYMIVDFEVVRHDNALMIIEYKGKHLMNTPEFRHKKALFSWCYPNIQYTVANKNDIVL